jgi:hypothetical protein
VTEGVSTESAVPAPATPTCPAIVVHSLRLQSQNARVGGCQSQGSCHHGVCVRDLLRTLMMTACSQSEKGSLLTSGLSWLCHLQAAAGFQRWAWLRGALRWLRALRPPACCCAIQLHTVHGPLLVHPASCQAVRLLQLHAARVAARIMPHLNRQDFPERPGMPAAMTVQFRMPCLLTSCSSSTSSCRRHVCKALSLAQSRAWQSAYLCRPGPLAQLPVIHFRRHAT